MDELESTVAASGKLISDARKLVVEALVQAVHHTMHGSVRKATAVVRSKFKQRVLYQVYAEFDRAGAVTSFVETECACKMGG